MTANMGTPMHPEGLSHFSVKALMANCIKAALKPRGQRNYVGLLPSEFRKLSGTEKLPETLTSSIEAVTNRLDNRPPFYFLAMEELPHDGCEGGATVYDVLSECQGGYVVQEEGFAGYIPDISIYASGAETPAVCIEVVDTSEPSPGKLMALSQRGVAVFRVDARGMHPQGAIFYHPLPAKPLTVMPCGKEQRRGIAEIDSFWDKAENPFVGIRFWPSGTQEYMYGERDPSETLSWHYGEPEIRAIRKKVMLWPSVEFVKPLPGKTKSITREAFVEYLMWLKVRIYIEVNSGAEGRATNLEANLLSNCDDLLHMVRVPG